MAWALEALAVGPAGAVKMTIKFEHEPTNDDQQFIRSETTGQYRRAYSGWPSSQPRIRKYELRTDVE